LLVVVAVGVMALGGCVVGCNRGVVIVVGDWLLVVVALAEIAVGDCIAGCDRGGCDSGG